jgi:hypothetical protein
MTTWLTGRYVRLLAPFALAAGLALALTFLGQASAETGAAGTQRRVIGAAVSNGFRVQVTAIRVPQAGAAPDTATVGIAAFERSGGSWDRLGRVPTVGQRSGWFWNVVTRPYGVRSLTLARPGVGTPAASPSGCWSRPRSGPPPPSGSWSTGAAWCRLTSSVDAEPRRDGHHTGVREPRCMCLGRSSRLLPDRPIAFDARIARRRNISFGAVNAPPLAAHDSPLIGRDH